MATPRNRTLAGVIASATLVCIAVSTALAVRAAGESPAEGVFLVASKRLADPNFAETVVLIVEAGEGGVQGIIVNRPGRLSLTQFFPEARRSHEAVYVGGPVGRRSLTALIRTSAGSERMRSVFGDVRLSQHPDLLRRLAVSESPGVEFRIFSGYAGWAPGQLENEIERGDWHVVEAEPEQVLDDRPLTLWGRLLPQARHLRAGVVPALGDAARRAR